MAARDRCVDVRELGLAPPSDPLLDPPDQRHEEDRSDKDESGGDQPDRECRTKCDCL
jgi:hypothetical protein